MQAADWAALLPLLVIAAASIATMLAIAVRRSHGGTAALTLAGLGLAFASLLPAAAAVPRDVTPLLVIDRYALFFTGLVVAAAFAVVLLSYSYLRRQEGRREEYYVLLLIATLGASVLASSRHFASLFLGIELLSVPLYVLIAYLPAKPLPIEAGLKYLVLAGVSSAFLLFGMALVYAELGTMEFARMSGAMARGGGGLLLPGVVLMITGFGFKLAVVPFHLWTPDVYQGAPAPVTAFVATVSKSGVFAALLRYFHLLGAPDGGPISFVFTAVAIASMLAGNLLALLQTSVKRILAYSSIAHLGYALVAFQAGGELGPQAVAFYLAAYSITTLGAFGVVTVLSPGDEDADALENYRALFWRRPGLAVVFTAMLLSLAGIPLTAGFLGKFYALAAGAASSMWLAVIVLAIGSAIGVYYYLRVVVTLYTPEAAPVPVPRIALSSGLTLAVLTALLIGFGVYPNALLALIRSAVAF